MTDVISLAFLGFQVTVIALIVAAITISIVGIFAAYPAHRLGYLNTEKSTSDQELVGLSIAVWILVGVFVFFTIVGLVATEVGLQ